MTGKLFRIIFIALLIFTGVTAIGGGIVLITDPTGQKMQFPDEAHMAIQNSIFRSFLVPGLCLALLIGIAAIVTAFLAIKRSKFYPLGLIYEGTALLIWLSIQLITIKMTSPLQFVYGTLGSIFIIGGVAIKWRKSRHVHVRKLESAVDRLQKILQKKEMPGV